MRPGPGAAKPVRRVSMISERFHADPCLDRRTRATLTWPGGYGRSTSRARTAGDAAGALLRSRGGVRHHAGDDLPLADPDLGGLLRGLLLLGALWWAWSAYAWLTNTLDPEEGGVRLAVLAAVAAMLVLSLAAPGAFGDDGVIFGVAYLIVRALHLVLFAIAGRGDPDLFRAALRTLPASAVAPVLLVVAGFLHGSSQLALWGAALVILYLGPLVGHMRGFRVSPEHFVERFGLIIIIALGESIVAIGVGAAGLPLDAGVIAAALLGITIAACLWWSYFDWVVYFVQASLAEATGARRAALARDAYSYLHLPMVGGIVLFAFGLKTALPDAAHPLPTIPALGLVG